MACTFASDWLNCYWPLLFIRSVGSLSKNRMGAYLQFRSRKLNHCLKAKFSKHGKGTKILYLSILTYLIFHLFQSYQMHYPNPTLGQPTTPAYLNYIFVFWLSKLYDSITGQTKQEENCADPFVIEEDYD